MSTLCLQFESMNESLKIVQTLVVLKGGQRTVQFCHTYSKTKNSSCFSIQLEALCVLQIHVCDYKSLGCYISMYFDSPL